MAGFYVVRDGGELTKLSSTSLAPSLTTTTTTSTISTANTTVPVTDSTGDTLEMTSSPTAITSFIQNIEFDVHSCSMCRKKFTNPSNLRIHMKNYHQMDMEHIVEENAQVGVTNNIVQQQPVQRVAADSAPPRHIPFALKSVPAIIGHVPSRVGTVEASRQSITTTVSSSSLMSSEPHRVQTSSAAVPQKTPVISPSETGVLSSEQIRQACSLIVEKQPGPFSCLACNLTFTSRENGIIHSRRSHLLEKPYACSCGTRFALAHARNQHKKICHLGESGIKAGLTPETPMPFSTVSSVYSSNNNTTTSTVTNKGSLPVSFISPKYATTTSNPKNTRPFFYANTLDDDNLPKTVEDAVLNTKNKAMEDSILPASPGSLGGMETETIPEDIRADSPVYLRIVEEQNMARQTTGNSSNDSYLNEYVAKDGILNAHQIEFANKMLQKEMIDGKAFYRCKICEQVLSQLNHGKSHVRHIHLQEQYKCGEQYCDKLFVSKNARDKHRIRFHGPSKKQQPQQSVTIIQSQIFVNQRQTSVKPRTNNDEPAGIHPNNVAAHIASYIGRRGDRFECKKCRKQFTSERNLKLHAKQLHFGRSHQCNSCGLYFEQGLVVHREKCMNPDRDSIPILQEGQKSTTPSTESGLYTAEVEHLNSIMRQSIEGTRVGDVETNFQCRLCAASVFDKRNLAEAHVWIEHIRNKWALTCGSNNVDEIYLQFLKAQFTIENPATGNDYVYAGSIKNAVYSNSRGNGEQWTCDKCPAIFKHYPTLEDHKRTFHDDTEFVDDEMNYEETEEEMPFDPLSLCSSEIYVEDASSLFSEKNVNDSNSQKDGRRRSSAFAIASSEGDVSAAVHCQVKVEEDEGNLYHEANDSSRNGDLPQFQIVGYDNKNMDGASEFAPSIVSVEGSSGHYGQGINDASPRLTQEQLDQLNLKALRFIREKGGQYLCIVCNRSSNLRRQLVEHVRRIHLLGEDEGGEEMMANQNSGKLGRNAPDAHHRLYCRYCEEYFESIRSRADHERHCTGRNKGATAITPAINFPNNPRNVASTPEERALRFVRMDKNEFTCSICSIRSTTQERVITHIRRIHFGEDDLLDKPNNKGKQVGKSALGRPKSGDPSFRVGAVGRSHLLGSTNKPKRHGLRPGSSHVQRGGPLNNSTLSMAVRRESGKPLGNLMVRPQPQRSSRSSSASSSVRDKTGSPSTRATANSHGSISSKGTEDNQIQSPVSTLENSINGNAQKNVAGFLTPSQVQQVKKMIMPWSVGGKYSFSKCKECNMLFTKYANAELHVARSHLNSEQCSADSGLESSFIQAAARVGKAPSEQRKTEIPNDDNEDNVDSNNLDDHFDSGVSDDEATVNEPPISPRKTRQGAADDVVKKYRQPPKKISSALTTPSSPTKGRQQPYHCVQCDKRFFHANHFHAHKKSCKGGTSNGISGNNKIKISANEDKIIEQAENGILTEEQSKAAAAQIVELPRKGKVGRYRCKICSLVLRGYAASALKHVRRIHYGELPFQCVKCQDRFKYQKPFENHELICDGTPGTKQAEEEGSKSGVVEEDEDVEHGNSATKNKLYRCKLCKEEIEDKPFIMYHLVSAHHEELQSMGKGASLEFMETMIDDVQVELKNDKSKSDNKNVSERHDVAKMGSLKRPAKNTQSAQQAQKSEQEQKCKVKILDTYSLNPDSPSVSNLGNVAGVTNVVEDSVGARRKTRKISLDNKVINVKQDTTAHSKRKIHVYKNKKELLKAIPEKGYYLTDDGKMETLYPSYVVLGTRQLQSGVSQDISNAVRQSVEKRKNGTYRCRNCDKTFETSSGCYKHVRKVHFETKAKEATGTQIPTPSQKAKKPVIERRTSGTPNVSENQMDLVDLLEIVFNRPPNTTGILTDEEITQAHNLIQTMKNSRKYACAACEVNDYDLENIQRHARKVHFGEKTLEEERMSSTQTNKQDKVKKDQIRNTGARLSSTEDITKSKKRKRKSFLSMKKKKRHVSPAELADRTVNDTEESDNDDDDSEKHNSMELSASKGKSRVFIKKERDEEKDLDRR